MAVTLWCMDSAATLKCNGYGLESWLAGHVEKRHYTLEAGLIRECIW